jgi:hypothetical protein
MHVFNRSLSVVIAMLCFGAATPLHADNPRERVVVSGVVTRVSGVPLSNAWVFLFQKEPGSLFFPMSGVILDACRTTQNGRFELRTEKWKHRALHQIIVPGRTIQRHPIKGEVVEEYRVLVSDFRLQSPNRLLVPNDFVPNAKDPRRGILDRRAVDGK